MFRNRSIISRRRLAPTFIVVVLVLASGQTWASIPEPPSVLYGIIDSDGSPLGPGDWVEARLGGEILASYVIGSIPAAGPFFRLQIALETPTDAGEPRNPGVARVGDQISFFVNGVDTEFGNTIGGRGAVLRVDLTLEVDILPPVDPTVISTSHVAGEWSKDNFIDLSWSGASDSGSGIDGYSIVNDTSESTQPDETVDVPHSTDPHEHTIGPLTESGDHHFHLSTCDVAGNCTSTVHAGPFRIDTTPPAAPLGVTSTSHSGPSSDTSIDMIWNASSDNLSGIEGYGFEFGEEADWLCDEGLDTSQNSATSHALADGDWYFHSCACDVAENWGQVSSAGPYTVEAVAPTCAGIGTVPDTGDGALSECEFVEVAITQISLVFSEEMLDPGGDSGDDDVTRPANYQLFGPGPDGTFETVDCSSGVAGSDFEISIDQVIYDSDLQTAHLYVNQGVPLPRGLYQLAACGTTTLTDRSGKPLDGDGDGIGGDDHVLGFEVAATNLLLNPNFDGDTSEWNFLGGVGAGLYHSGSDADEKTTSGAAEITGTAGEADSWLVVQCVGVTPDRYYTLSGRVEIVSGLTELPVFGQVEFFGGTGCSGDPLGTFITEIVVGDTAESWVDIVPAIAGADSQAQSARVGFAVEPTGPVAFEVYFDSVSFSEYWQLVFWDGFESGDAGEWSRLVSP